MARLASQTIFKWHDNSQIADLNISATATPVIMLASTTDKGTEELTKISGSDFYKMFVSNKKTMFTKHGQPLIQAASLIDAGATLLFQRVTAPDAKLANIIVSVTVTKNTESSGAKIKLKYKVDTVENADSMATVSAHAATLLDTDDENVKTFPLFAITDVGRNVSNKKIRIIPDYSTARELSFMRYYIQILEDTNILENIYFALDQDLQYAGSNYGLDAVIKSSSKQVKSKTFESYMDSFIEFVAESLETTVDKVYAEDIIFGCTRTGKNDTNIEIASDSINLNNTLGIHLLSGSNGIFAENPLAQTDAYDKAMTDVFDGTLTNEIYDVDKYQIDAIFDANYPDDTKRAIEILADYREDLFYFRDLGFVKTYDQIKAKSIEVKPSRFSATYHNSYDINDPYSKKQVPVTITYSLSKLFINHYRNGKANPFEGIKHGPLFL